MRNISMMGRSVPLAGVIAVFLLVGGVSAAFVTMFTITRSGSVIVATTSGIFQLFSVRTGPMAYTTPVTTLVWPTVYEGAGTISQGPTIFVYTGAVTGTEEIKYKWTATGVPAGATLTAEQTEDEGATVWANFPSNTLNSRSFMVDHKGCGLRFKLDVGSNPAGSYPIVVSLEVQKGP